MKDKETGIVYCFSNGTLPTGEYHGLAVSADGHILAQCISSTVDWLKVDLGTTEGSKKCWDKYIRHYPGGFETEWVDEPSEHAGMLEAQRLNRLHAEAMKKRELEHAAMLVASEEAKLAEEIGEADGND